MCPAKPWACAWVACILISSSTPAIEIQKRMTIEEEKQIGEVYVRHLNYGIMATC
jgi:hypothetical protein